MSHLSRPRIWGCWRDAPGAARTLRTGCATCVYAQRTQPKPCGQGATMPRLVFSSEKAACGATIELDNGDRCLISVARAGVLVRSHKKGWLNSIFGSFFGPVLYSEGNAYQVAKTAAALELKYPQVQEPLAFSNSDLSVFASAIWHCSSAAEVAIMLNEAASRDEPRL